MSAGTGSRIRPRTAAPRSTVPAPDGKAACGWYLRGIVYAELSPNCRKCEIGS